jgi:hypothetical protein
MEIPSRQMHFYLQNGASFKITAKNNQQHGSPASLLMTSITDKQIISNEFGVARLLFSCEACEATPLAHLNIQLQSPHGFHEITRILFFRK